MEQSIIKKSSSLIVITAITLIILISAVPEVIASGQSSSLWSSPQLLAQTDGHFADSGVALLADDFGHLHFFYTHYPENGIDPGIDYLFWDGLNWSEPVNIIAPRSPGNLAYVRAAIDPDQVIHLIWNNGIDLQ